MAPDHAQNLRLIKSFGFLLAVFGSSLSNSFCGIGLGTYVVALALEAALDRTHEWRPYPAWRLALPLLVSLAVSVWISDHPWASLRGYGKYLEGFALLYAGLDVIRSEKDKQAFLIVLAAAYALSVSSGVYQWVFGVDFVKGYPVNYYFTGIKRLTGTFKNCNDYGTFLVPGVVFSLALGLDAARRKKWAAAVAWLALFSASGWVLLQTLSRGAILSAGAALFVLGLFFGFRRRAVLLWAGALALLWVVPSLVRERLHELASLRAGSVPERMILVNTSLRMIAQNPVFGLGLNTYSLNFPQFKPPDYPALMYSHNSYLQMATESGVLGTALFVAFIAVVMFGCAKRLLARKDTEASKVLGAALLSGAFGILVNCLFDSALQSTQLRTLFWSLLGAALAVSAL